MVISYLESLADGRRFVSAAEKLAQRKPLLILKAGKGESGQRAAYSHTGRLAGKYEVFSSIMRQSGIREVRDIRTMLNAGADKVSINTAGVKNPGLFEEAAGRYGAQCIVAAIDAKQCGVDQWQVYIHGGRTPTPTS